ncbi:ferritin-like domain-containing protein [Saccharopolyspora cebuensis]|uniref:Ferritin-like domain-containing protein n=1 Tax=Saccharopolyspora cebuensis TaxID=418759 RepID=A0ABV4CRA9_9PSEU
MTELSDEASRALRDALAAEHAAVWVYGLASAFTTESRVRDALQEALDAHERQRAAATRLIRAAGQAPPAPRPAYDVGVRPTDQTTAIEAVLIAERDCQVGWRAVIERTEDGELRRTGLDGLSTSAARATRWRLTIGQQPAAQAFPGQP